MCASGARKFVFVALIPSCRWAIGTSMDLESNLATGAALLIIRDHDPAGLMEKCDAGTGEQSNFGLTNQIHVDPPPRNGH